MKYIVILLTTFLLGCNVKSEDYTYIIKSGTQIYKTNMYAIFPDGTLTLNQNGSPVRLTDYQITIYK